MEPIHHPHTPVLHFYDPCVKVVFVVKESSTSDEEHNWTFNIKHNTDCTSVQNNSEECLEVMKQNHKCLMWLMKYLLCNIYSITPKVSVILNKVPFITLDELLAE